MSLLQSVGMHENIMKSPSSVATAVYEWSILINCLSISRQIQVATLVETHTVALGPSVARFTLEYSLFSPFLKYITNSRLTENRADEHCSAYGTMEGTVLLIPILSCNKCAAGERANNVLLSF